MSLPDLSLARYRFTLRALEPLNLPPYKGSVLRGGFGYVFRRTVCAQPARKRCVGCLLQHHCAYGTLFAPSPPPGAEVLRKNEAVPRPFVIEPPPDRRTDYAADECLDFGLVLVGRAVDYLPYFIIVFEALGQRGLGRQSGHFELEQVMAEHPSSEPVIVFAAEEMDDSKLPVTATEVQAHAATLPADHIRLRFLTPTRLVHRGKPLQCPPFHVLARRLLNRVSSLSYFHCGQRWETDYRGLVEQAKAVELAACDTHWVNVERYSSRQRAKLSLGGFVGDVVYTGDLAPFLPLLCLGELVHVGKATVFGNGKYEVGSKE
jgi:hypothetical protein